MTAVIILNFAFNVREQKNKKEIIKSSVAKLFSERMKISLSSSIKSSDNVSSVCLLSYSLSKLSKSIVNWFSNQFSSSRISKVDQSDVSVNMAFKIACSSKLL